MSLRLHYQNRRHVAHIVRFPSVDTSSQAMPSISVDIEDQQYPPSVNDRIVECRIRFANDCVFEIERRRLDPRS